MPWFHVIAESGRVIDQVERVGDDDAGEWASRYHEVLKVEDGVVFVTNESEDFARGLVVCPVCHGKEWAKTFPPAGATLDEVGEWEEWECDGCGETADLEVK
jgi:hypothetical protein